MATNNNLTDFLTAVADAIREKNGTTDVINPQDMPGMIATICNTSPVFFTTADNSDTNVSALCTSIANAIRAKKSYDSTKLINPQDFPEEIRGISVKTCMKITASQAITVLADGEEVSIPANTETEVYMSTSFSPNSNGAYITKIDCSALDTSNFTNMENMFNSCTAITTLDVSGFKMSNVTSIAGMFTYVKLTTLDLSNWNTSQMKNMGWMFYGSSIQSVGDISGWDVSKVTAFEGMFYGCSSLSSFGDINKWDTSNSEAFCCMFQNCTSLPTTLDLSNWKTSKVTNLDWMFTYDNIRSLDLSGWDTSSLTTMTNMLAACSYLTELRLGPGWGKQTNNVTLRLDECGRYSGYLSTASLTSMLDMYDRAANGLTSMTIRIRTNNAPTNWTANMQARGYTITVG